MAVARFQATSSFSQKFYRLTNSSIITSTPHGVRLGRCYSSDDGAARPSKASKAVRKAPKNHRIVVTRAKNSFMKDGSFLMTPHVADFFTRYDLEHDTSNTQRLQLNSPDLHLIRSRFGLEASWTSKHLVDPYKLDLFAPRGHALQVQMMAQLRERAETRPLWIFTTFAASAQQTIRFTLTKRLRSAVYAALEEKGYNKYGYKHDGTMIRGTLWLHAPDPVKAVNQPKELFGPPVVRLLEEACGLVEPVEAPSGHRPRDGNTKQRKIGKVGNERFGIQVKARTRRT